VEEAHAALGTTSLPGDVQVLDRLSVVGKDADAAVLGAFDATGREPCVLVGFSLGAMWAMKLAALRPERVSRIVLVSPAAPLELGNFLPSMAGRAVFETAQRGLWPLSALSAVQSLVTRWAPEMLLTGMFQGSARAELDLSLEPAFRRALLASLRTCLTLHRSSYHRELMAYVRPWASTLEQVRCDVQIHHGDADTWAPLAMSKALEDKLQGKADLIVSSNLGHFSMLHACLQDVLNTAMAR
jgi:pimeloyl-ACP methyl ester carboxylesterase